MDTEKTRTKTKRARDACGSYTYGKQLAIGPIKDTTRRTGTTTPPTNQNPHSGATHTPGVPAGQR